jgi:hypothetical protein
LAALSTHHLLNLFISISLAIVVFWVEVAMKGRAKPVLSLMVFSCEAKTQLWDFRQDGQLMGVNQRADVFFSITFWLWPANKTIERKIGSP